MKKIACVLACLVISVLPTGCTVRNENTVNRILFDTTVTITGKCSRSVLLEAIKLCEYYEGLLSRTLSGSDVYRINHGNGFVKVSNETLHIIETALEYCRKTNGKYDITVTPVSELWDFKNNTVPDSAALRAALEKVDYTKIEIKNGSVNANGAQIDLGSAAKGYITDKLHEFFVEQKVSQAAINLGGNLYVMGKDYQTVGIRSPSNQNETVGSVKLLNKTAVTSGIYQRCFEKNGVFYHHIIDTATGYGVNNDLAGVTVFGESSLVADIMSTACMASGSEQAQQLLSKTNGVQAVLILRNGNIITTPGITQRDGMWIIN